MVDPQILSDYRKVQSEIERFFGGSSRNFTIVKPDYMVPTLAEEEVPLEDERGELAYFRELRAVLEEAMIHGKIDRERLPDHAPDYLEALAVTT